MAEPYGDNIRARREQLGITRSELAKMIGRSYHHVYNLEHEENTADPAVLNRIATALHLPIEQVMRPQKRRAESTADPKAATSQPKRQANPTSHPQPTRPEPPPRESKPPTKVADDRAAS